MKMTPLGVSEFMNSAVELSEALFGGVVTISGSDYEAAVSTITEGGELSLGVEKIEAILRVRLRKALYPARPVHGSTLLTYEGRLWRVDEVTDDKIAKAWSLSCVLAEQ
jgi:hypothetical protein